ncbi:MAG: rfaE bifunctional protein kinase chain/domain, partial [Rhodothermales bacterium]
MQAPPLHPDSSTVLDQLRTQAGGGKVVFVSGNFNIVHPGHLRLLRFARECGDLLVVGVNADSFESGIVLPEELRLEGVKAISWLDHAFILRDSAADVIAALQPHAVVKGKEHQDHINPEAAAVAGYGGKLLFSSGDVTFSSLDLLAEEFRRSGGDFQRAPDYLVRHNITPTALIDGLRRVASLRVVVIGELIVDEYVTCDPLGMSREDPTIVVTPVATDRFIGGAGIVAAHAAGLGAQVDFVSVVGEDDAAQFAAAALTDSGVRQHLLQDESRPTIRKQRFRADGKTLLRVSHLRQHALSQELSTQIVELMPELLADCDLLVFADFNYGLLHQRLVEQLVAQAEARGILVVADSQSSSQTGDVSRFRNTTLLTPTEHEARLAVRDFDSGLVIVADALRRQANAKHVLIT